MRVIGVIDLKAGRAVHARGGVREVYEPVGGRLVPPDRAGDAAALARAYRDVLKLGEIYVADLDAIGGRSVAREDLGGGPIGGIVASGEGVPVMVDAGISTVSAAARLLEVGVDRVVVGLETLPSFEALERIVTEVGGSRVVFSLDVRAGRPVATTIGLSEGTEGIGGGGTGRTGAAGAGGGGGGGGGDGGANHRAAVKIARRAVQAGAASVLLIDLSRVGTGTGVDLDLVGALRAACDTSELLVGGGVRGPADLEALEHLRCDGVLMGTALHEGLSVAGRWANIRNAPSGGPDVCVAGYGACVRGRCLFADRAVGIDTKSRLVEWQAHHKLTKVTTQYREAGRGEEGNVMGRAARGMMAWAAAVAVTATVAGPASAQSVRLGVVMDLPRQLLERSWSDDPHQVERAYCVSDWSYGVYHVSRGQPVQDDTVFRVFAVREAVSNNAGPSAVDFDCPDGMPELHVHTPTTCMGDDVSTCVGGGLNAYSCQPSRGDLEKLVQRRDQFAVVQCDRHAFRFYYPMEYGSPPTSIAAGPDSRRKVGNLTPAMRADMPIPAMPADPGSGSREAH